MRTIPIDQAKNADLFFYCETVLGLEIKRGMNDAQLRAKISAAQPNITEIQVSDGPSTETPAHSQAVSIAGRSAPIPEKIAGIGKAPSAGQFSDPIVAINIPSTREPGGDKDVFVMINEVQWIIQRDHWVDVPLRVYMNLYNATERTYEERESADGRGRDRIARDNPSYPFMARNVPTDEEIRAWEESMAVNEAA